MSDEALVWIVGLAIIFTVVVETVNRLFRLILSIPRKLFNLVKAREFQEES